MNENDEIFHANRILLNSFCRNLGKTVQELDAGSVAKFLIERVS